jgi:hypothetical protein
MARNARLELRQRQQGRDRGELGVARNHRRHRGGAAAIWDVLQLDVGLATEQLDDEMGLRRRARRGVVELAGIGPRELDELRERMGGYLGIDQKQQRVFRHHADGREVALRIVGQFRVGGGNHRETGGHY